MLGLKLTLPPSPGSIPPEMNLPIISKPTYAAEFNPDAPQPVKICMFSDKRDRDDWIALNPARRPVSAPEIRNQMGRASRAAKRHGVSQWSKLTLEGKRAGFCFSLILPDAPLPRDRSKRTGKPNDSGFQWSPPPEPKWSFPPESPFSSFTPRELELCESFSRRFTSGIPEGSDLESPSRDSMTARFQWETGLSLGAISCIVSRIHDKLGHEILRDGEGRQTSKRDAQWIVGAWKDAVKTALPLTPEKIN